MTKSEITILRDLYGYRTGNQLYKPNVVSNTEDGLIIGSVIQANTRYHVAAQRLVKAGLAEMFKHGEDADRLLVVPAYR